MKTIPKDSTYRLFLDIVYKKLCVDKKKFNLELCTLVDADGTNCYPKINNDEDVAFMLNMTKKMPIVYVKVVQSPIFDPICTGSDIFNHDTNDDVDDESDSYDEDKDGNDEGFESDERDRNEKDDNLNWIFNVSPRVNVDSAGKNDEGFEIPGAQNFSLVPITDEVPCLRSRRNFDLGEIFPSKEDIKCKLHLYALNENFEARVKRSSKTEFVAGCKKKDCSFYFRATKLIDSRYWQIVHCNETHTCSVNVLDSRLRTTSSKVIGGLMAPKLNFSGVALKPKDIMATMKLQWGLEIPYSKAWMAKEHAESSVFGDANQSFNLLPSYFYMVEQMNPGTITSILTDDDNCFTCCFWMFRASINGFKLTRPVIAIDGTHLKGRFKGILFVAVGVDANEQVYPLAFGIAHIEETSSWSWFLSQLRRSIGCPSGLMLISDQHPSIKLACTEIYPDAPHGLCTYHIKNRLKIKVNCKTVLELYRKAYECYSRTDFAQKMDAIRECNSKAHDALVKLGVERWSRAYAPRRRFNVMTSNVAESMNSALRHARQMPVVCLLEFIRDMFQRWFHQRRESAKSITTSLSPYATGVLTSSRDKSHYMEVYPINCDEFQVKHSEGEEIVNLKEKTCTCCMFQSIMLPCEHACAAISKQKLPYMDFCSIYYHKSSYISEYGCSIYPVGNYTSWVVPEEVSSRVVLPPSWYGRQAGRPHKRYTSMTERSRQRRCKLCNELGHNRRTCTNPTGAITGTPNPRQTRKRRACSICREVGHTKKDCASAPSSSTHAEHIDLDF